MIVNLLYQKLINLLEQDAQQGSEALDKQLGVSSSTVRRRVTEQGVLHIIAIPEPDKIVLPLTAIIAFDVSREGSIPLWRH